jgi:hypothetical protein
MVNSVHYSDVVSYSSRKLEKTDSTKKSAQEWRQFWLGKFNRIAVHDGIDTERSSEMYRILSNFLEDSPGAPYYVKPKFRSR